MIPIGASVKPATVGSGEALRLYQSSLGGLEDAEAEKRLTLFGPNRLPEKPQRSAWAQVFAQLRGFLNIILIGAAVLAGLIGDAKDAAIIVAVVIFNTILGFLQEYRAERALAALKAMVALRARVLRGGKLREISADTLVPGDVVQLEAGDRIPSDGRLLEAHNLEVDESALTGESLPVPKQVEAVVGDDAPIGERVNSAFLNTVVTRGRGLLLVTATGNATEMGRVAGMLKEAVEPATPLQQQLDHLGKLLAVIAVGVVGTVSVFGWLRGETWVKIAFEAIALAVAAIPEGLPAVVTVTLALGVHRMARNRAIVKRLAAVETLGCTTVICTDKTGTLTVNQMTARALWYRQVEYQVSGEGYRPEGHIEAVEGTKSTEDFDSITIPLVLCNDSRVDDGKVLGDPTEGALLTLALKSGLDANAVRVRLPRIAELPFDSEKKFMATFHLDGKMVRIFVKGAPDVLLDRCGALLGTAGEVPLGRENREEIKRQNEIFGTRGLRVLAVASGTTDRATIESAQDLDSVIAHLTFVGLIGLMDPPRPEARQAIELCKAAGISVKMITGDHRGTAAAIATELGLRGEVLDGAELERMNDAELARRVGGTVVFARVSPEHKLRIVRTLKGRGQVVAMTGDGVNDAPALKTADIGVGMGSGTEVAKQAATMVLADDNFATIVGAVREGRAIYDNIVKFLSFQLSTNMAAILTVFSAPLFGLPTPLKPIHILFVAIFADGPPAIALGFDPPRPSVMQEPPRDPNARMLTMRRLGVLVFYGVIMATGTVGLMHAGGRDADHAATLAFTAFVLYQIFNLLNVRSEGRSAFNRQLFANYRLWVAVGVVLAMQVTLVNWAPLRRVFETVPLSLTEWGVAALFASLLVVLDEVRKLAARRVREWKPIKRSRN